MPRSRTNKLHLTWLYARALVHEFRWTLLALCALVALGTALNYVGRGAGEAPPLGDACYDAWMALFAQAPRADTWCLKIVNSVFPLFGIVLIGEGIVRLGLLLASRRQGEKEWMRVMASTYKDHIVLCGLGHLGYRVLEQLLAAGEEVVALEKESQGRFVAQAKANGAAVLTCDVKDDAALLAAGVERARTIIIATNSDMANVEVALDARRMNPKIKVILRLFDQQVASKLLGALTLDAAFSTSALAAPTVAAMAIDSHVLASYQVNGVPHVVFEFHAGADSPLLGRTVASLESEFEARVVARLGRGGAPQPPADTAAAIGAGDILVLHVAAARMGALTAAQGAGHEAARSA